MRKMEFTDFVNNVVEAINREAIKKKLDITAEIKTNIKNNGVKVTGIEIFNDSNIRPVIYLEQFYNEYCSFNKSFEDIVQEIWKTYDKSKLEINTEDLFKLWSTTKRNVYPKLVSIDMNDFEETGYAYTYIAAACEESKGELECTGCGKNYKKVLAVIYYYEVPVTCGHGTITITENLLKQLDINVDTLHEAAIENLKARNDYLIKDITSVLSELIGAQEQNMFEEEPNETSMYVLTSENHLFAAAYILLPEVVEEIINLYKRDILLLPSSIHEWILLPDTGEKNYEEIKGIIRSVNDTMLDKKDILSYDLLKITKDGYMVLL